MLKQSFLPIALLASTLAAAPGLAQQADTFVPQVDNLACAPPYGPAQDTPPMSRQNTVERVVGAGQTATLCLTRDSTVTVAGVHCRRTEGGEQSGQSVTAAPRPDAGPAPQGEDPAPQGAGALPQMSGAGAQIPGATARRGANAAPGAAPGGAPAVADMERTWNCPSGMPCFGEGGFLPGSRQATLDPNQVRFCVRYLNADQTSHTVRADFVFSYPAR